MMVIAWQNELTANLASIVSADRIAVNHLAQNIFMDRQISLVFALIVEYFRNIRRNGLKGSANLGPDQ